MGCIRVENVMVDVVEWVVLVENVVQVCVVVLNCFQFGGIPVQLFNLVFIVLVDQIYLEGVFLMSKFSFIVFFFECNVFDQCVFFCYVVWGCFIVSDIEK